MADLISGDTIDKSDIIGTFDSNIRDLIKTQPVWYTGSSNPGWGFPTSWLGPQDPNGPTEGELDPTVTASNVVSILNNWCNEYSKVRKFNFIRTGNVSPYNSTVVANLSNQPLALQEDLAIEVEAEAPAFGVESGSTINANEFNNYMDSLYSRWNTYKDNVYTYSVYYCHNSCHSSCHSSFRVRR